MDRSTLWTLFAFLLLLSIFDAGVARRSLERDATLEEQPDSTESRLESVENSPGRLPRKFRENSRTRRLHIENQTGFDGKVDKIHINSDEDLSESPAYEAPTKILTKNGYVEKMLPKKAEEEADFGARVARAIEAYGKSKEQLETNGEIERVHPSASMTNRARGRARQRVIRSIESEAKLESKEESKGNLEDLEAQDAKVFRPLFVYRQQIAKKQHRGKNQIYGYQVTWNPWRERRPVY